MNQIRPIAQHMRLLNEALQHLDEAIALASGALDMPTTDPDGAPSGDRHHRLAMARRLALTAHDLIDSANRMAFDQAQKESVA